MSESLKLSIELPASPETVYHAWLDGAEHAAFTGSPARIDPRVGGKYEAWDGYISGVTQGLQPPRRIVQTWRTTEFPEDAPDSLLEVLIEPIGTGTQLTLVHTQIPDGQSKEYEQGWQDYYFEPMKAYFEK
ncbi:MAG TPA: SRPBCC domain-containing protein [Longilinea sp.]|nr:SRPBCC domain-containing protein [Longilinea sp.]